MKRFFAALLLVSFATTLAVPASAALAPAKADAQAKEAFSSGAYSFCKHPHKPLPPHAKDLCSLAKDIPDCQGYVEACEGKEETPKMDLGWLKEILGVLAQFGIWILVAAIVVVLAVPIVQAIVKARRNRKLEDAPLPKAPDAAEEPPLEDLVLTTDAERLLRLAEEHLAQGRLDRALFGFLHAALRALDERGAIRIERHRTNGEYVRGCREDTAKRPLREIVREVDKVKFGGVRADADAVSRARERAVALVRMVPMALLAIFLLGGCSNVVHYAKGTDPSEDSLLVDLLKRQGAKITPVGASLATLPFPKEGQTPPVVIVDAERVPLQDEARERLVAWVDKGGVLVLAGEPKSWPKAMHASRALGGSYDVRVRVFEADDEEAGDDDQPLVKQPPAWTPGKLARASALEWPEGEQVPIALLGDGKLYAAVWTHGAGRVLGVANDDLFTNAGLARPGNARALVQMLSALGENAFQIARPEDGITPPTSPLSSLVEAGLGKGLVHSAFGVLFLFLAFGMRQARPRPTPPPTRRAFAEHVEATGALYARTKVSGHALAAYAKYADARLRAQMPRGTSDPGAFLAARTGKDPTECARLWARAQAAVQGKSQGGDDLIVLRDLAALVSAATG